MSLITIMVENVIKNYYFINLEVEMAFVRMNYDWLKLERRGKVIFGTGSVNVNGVKYTIELKYSPFYKQRMDRIFITNHKIEFNDDIHVYGDSSLCLYHPVIDKPANAIIPLYKMIPWITEWCHFYGEWKKYGVWLGKEIKHTRSFV